jgi:hypothetical protein
MEGPSDDFRASILEEITTARAQVLGATDEDAENALVRSLAAIEERLVADVAESSRLNELRAVIGAREAAADHRPGPHADLEATGWDLLAAVQAWAGLASAVVAQVYAPASPWPRSIAGWGKKATAAIQKVTKLLLGPLQVAAKAVGAGSWSISVGFPWGVSIGVGWP